MPWKVTVFAILLSSLIFLTHSSYCSQLSDQGLTENPKNRVIKILVIDGGGMRGLIPTDQLKDLENEFKKPLCEIFDLIIGTSTGGLLALGAAHGKTAAEMEEVYKTQGKTIFSTGWVYWLESVAGLRKPFFENQHLKQVVESFIGEQSDKGTILLNQAKTNIGVTFYDSNARKPRLLTSYNPQDSVFMLDAGMVTAAAPTYFPEYIFETKSGQKLKGVDGGVGNNNPALTAYQEARKLFPQHERFVLLSLGTGFYRPPLQLGSGGIYDFVVTNGGFSVMIDAQVSLTHTQLKAMTKYDPKLAYFRINPKLPREIDLSSTKEEDWEILLAAARSHAAKKVLTEFIQFLQPSDNRLARSELSFSHRCCSKKPTMEEFQAHFEIAKANLLRGGILALLPQVAALTEPFSKANSQEHQNKKGTSIQEERAELEASQKIILEEADRIGKRHEAEVRLETAKKEIEEAKALYADLTVAIEFLRDDLRKISRFKVFMTAQHEKDTPEQYLTALVAALPNENPAILDSDSLEQIKRALSQLRQVNESLEVARRGIEAINGSL